MVMMSRLMPLPLTSRRWVANQWEARRTRMLLAVFVAALLVLVLTAVARNRVAPAGPGLTSGGGSGQWHVAAVRDFDVIISATGELEPRDQVEVRNGVEGRTSIVEVVDEGASVQRGDVLARLADDELRNRIETQLQQVEQALAEKVASEENLAIQRAEAERRQREAQTKLALAMLDLKKWEEGDDVKRQRDLGLALEKATRNIERVRRDLIESKALHAERFISDNELEDAEIAVIEAENSLATAKLDIEVYRRFTRPKEQRDVQSKVEDSEAELALTIDRNQREIRRLEADVQNKTRTLELRQQALAKLEAQLERTVILAPTDGLVVYGTSVGRQWERGDPLRPGREVHFNQLMFILPDTRQMVAVLRVHEAMLPQVREGQPVRVRIDARPGEVIEGRVTQIAVMAESGRWWSPDVREYGVRVLLPPGFDDALKPAMRCSGEIIADRVTEALAVPLQAVFAEGEQRFAYIDGGGGKLRRQPVSIARHSDLYVEVTDGLAVGDRVLLRRPRTGELD
jgi:HlyD family secretion protein